MLTQFILKSRKFYNILFFFHIKILIQIILCLFFLLIYIFLLKWTKI